MRAAEVFPEQKSCGLLSRKFTAESKTRKQTGSERTRLVNFAIASISIGKHKEPYFMIIFEDAPPKKVQKRGRRSSAKPNRNRGEL